MKRERKMPNCSKWESSTSPFDMWSAQVESGASTWANQQREKNRYIANHRATTTSINVLPTSTISVVQIPGVSAMQTTKRASSRTTKCPKRAPRQGGCHPWKPKQLSASELGLPCWAHNPNSINSTTHQHVSQVYLLWAEIDLKYLYKYSKNISSLKASNYNRVSRLLFLRLISFVN